MGEIIKHNGYDCRIVKNWDNQYYDLETIENTELGIKEIFLSVSREELIREGNYLN